MGYMRLREVRTVPKRNFWRASPDAYRVSKGHGVFGAVFQYRVPGNTNRVLGFPLPFRWVTGMGAAAQSVGQKTTV